MAKKHYTVEEVRTAVHDNKSMAGVLRALNLKPVGGNYKTVKSIISDNGIDTSHFTGQGWNIGLKFKPNKGIEDSSIFIENSNYRCSWRLRERYKKKTGINHCECCELVEWQGKPIPLEIHHINGVNTDNRIDNLQLLCPNCHALTNNYRGKNTLSALSEKREVERRKFKETSTAIADGNLEPSLNNEEGAETRHDASKKS